MVLPAIPLLAKGLMFLKDPKIIIILVVIAVVAYSAKATVDNIQEASYNAGVAAERAVWVAKEEKEKLAYETEVNRLKQLVLDTETSLKNKLAEVETKGKDKLQEVINEKDTTIANLRSGNLRLSIELRNTSAEAATTELAGATAVRYATYRAELSETASEFLITFGADADRAAVSLGVCQETIRTYRETVEEYNRKYSTYVF